VANFDLKPNKLFTTKGFKEILVNVILISNYQIDNGLAINKTKIDYPLPF